MRHSRSALVLTSSLALALLVGACGPAATSAPTTAPTNAPSAPASDGPAPTDVAAEPCDPTVVKVAQGATTLIYAPVYLAQSQGYFADEGITVEVENVVGAAALQALTGGSVDYALTVSGTSLTAVARGLDITAIQATTSAVTLGVVIRQDVADERNLTADMSLEDKLAGLKGLTIGYTAPGAATDVYGRWLIEQGGLDPEADVTLVALGETSALVAALAQGQIDVFTASPPTIQTVAAGDDAMILVNMVTDVPDTANFVYSILLAAPDYLAENGETARCLTRAIARGMEFLLDEPEAAKEALLADFNVDPAILDEAVDSLMDAYPRGGRMTEAMWQRAIDLQFELGIIESTMDATEGALWTNDYLE